MFTINTAPTASPARLARLIERTGAKVEVKTVAFATFVTVDDSHVFVGGTARHAYGAALAHIKSTYADSVALACDATCWNATGNDCECACGGKYHGAHAIAA
jgi:glutamate racemase